MPKFTKEELASRINDLEIADDVKLSLMEDVSDSIIDEAEAVKEISDKLEAKTKEYDDLLAKYKERFMTSDKEVDEEQDLDVESEEVIDVKELF